MCFCNFSLNRILFISMVLGHQANRCTALIVPKVFSSCLQYQNITLEGNTRDGRGCLLALKLYWLTEIKSFKSKFEILPKCLWKNENSTLFMIFLKFIFGLFILCKFCNSVEEIKFLSLKSRTLKILGELARN